MKFLKAIFALVLLCTFSVLPHTVHAGDAVRIGVLTDMTGSKADYSGYGSVEAAQMAAEDMGGAVGNKPFIILNADFQNRADLAQEITNTWHAKHGVDVVVDVPNGPVARELQDKLKQQGTLLLSSSPNTQGYSSKDCQSHSLAWLYDRDILANNLVRALVDDKKMRWFIIKNDDGYSHDLAKTVRKKIRDSGAEMVGEAQFGKRMSGLDIILTQAQSLKPDIIFLALDQPELLHVLKHWKENHNKECAPVAFANLPVQELFELDSKPMPRYYTAAPFYWNQDYATREWSKRFAARNRGMMPSSTHASVYSATRHYLHSLRQNPNAAPEKIMLRMRETPLNDALFRGGQVRRDGLMLHRLHILASQPAPERLMPWDVMHITRSLHPSVMDLPPETVCAQGN